ncbi:hypothetical protein C1H46_011737 [Malus baccata]|uniref:U3 small nucleolar RNA-associated protein 13 C-terminal domain-containing protein n=1 Tax=Malus baccata TaxID=106549 RepID=A0A540MV81_MALBA|nr:hypothetical protein C1H46_011737 [Malus baccata]
MAWSLQDLWSLKVLTFWFSHLSFADLISFISAFLKFGVVCRKRETEKQIEKAFLPLARKRSSCYFAYVRERNTKAKLCHVAHFVLLKVLNILSPTKINEIKGVGEILEGLPSYSQRHFSRMDKHETDTYLNQRQIQGYCMTSL